MTQDQPRSAPDAQAPRQADQIPEIAADWLAQGRRVTLAVVIETWGSAPRPVGALMVVDGAGAMMGSVSGGCVEGAVVAEAMAGGRSRVLTYGVADEEAFAVGLACGGTIRVLLLPLGQAPGDLAPQMLQELVAARAAARPLALVSDLADLLSAPLAHGDMAGGDNAGSDIPGGDMAGGRHRLVARGEDPAVDRALMADRSGLDEGRFVAVHNPPLRLIVVGAVQIAQSLVPMARALGHRVTLIDPRSAFGSAGRFPQETLGETLLEDWPDEALPRLALDGRSALVTLTHDAKLDDPAIAFALRSPVYYIGCLGSTRTHAKRLERLAALGFGPEALTRLHAPAGLAIGAKSPAEIALSIMAEIVQVLRKGA